MMLLWLGILSASCIFDGESCYISADEPHEIIFTVSVNGQRTRATWGEEYEDKVGVPFDYRINPEELRMVVLTDNGTRIGQIDDVTYWPINEAHTQFQFMGRMPQEFVEHINAFGAGNATYRFMVLANCGSSMTGEEYITYSQSQLDPKSETAAIPMWGVIAKDVTPLLDGQNLDLGDISLLRAAAKVEVKLSDALKAKNTEINAATLKYYNRTGYVLPSGWSQVASTLNIDQENCIRVYRHAAVNMPLVKDEKSGVYYVYIPEYDNVNYLGERNKISLEVNVGGENKYFEDAISFCEYSNGKPVENSDYSIVRNHIYEFEIRNIAGSSLMLEYHVADWDAEDWGTGKDYEEHDISYPTYLNPIVPKDYLTAGNSQLDNYVISAQPQMYFGGLNDLEAGAFVGYFRITAPLNVQWKPGFMGSKENYRIRVYKVDKNLEEESVPLFDSGVNDMQGNLPACGADEWFKLVVFPLSGDGAGSTTIQLGVSYYQEWTNQYINLFINGEYNAVRWPNSGNNPKIIEIKHIEQVHNASEE